MDYQFGLFVSVYRNNGCLKVLPELEPHHLFRNNYKQNKILCFSGFFFSFTCINRCCRFILARLPATKTVFAVFSFLIKRRLYKIAEQGCIFTHNRPCKTPPFFCRSLAGVADAGVCRHLCPATGSPRYLFL